MTSLDDFASIVRGRNVTTVRRVRYELAGTLRSDNGPLEITFDDSAIVLQPASDGELLAIESQAWTDPFAAPLSTENEEYVRTHGKWTAFDISKESPYDRLIGTQVELILPISNPGGAIVGLEVTFELAVLRVEVEADELLVDLASVSPD